MRLFPFNIENKKYADKSGTDYRKICIYSDFDPDLLKVKNRKKNIKKNGFAYGKYLLKYLEEKHGSENYKLILRHNPSNTCFINKNSTPISIEINIDEYIDGAGNKKAGVRYAQQFVELVNIEKLLESENNMEDIRVVIDIVKKVVEKFGRLSSGDKQEIVNLLINSDIELQLIKSKSKEKDTIKNLKQFLICLDEEKDANKLQEITEKMKNSQEFIDLFKTIARLDKKKQAEIIENIDDVVSLWPRIKKIKDALKSFESLIEEHNKKNTKNEKEIHAYLIEHPYLLGFEYFDKPIKM